MSDKNLISTKKCLACQQWSHWQQQVGDQCEHCGALLDPRAYAEAEQQAVMEQRDGIELMEIGPEDKGLMWVFKHMVRSGQLLFIAIVGFIVWLVTALAG